MGKELNSAHTSFNDKHLNVGTERKYMFLSEGGL